MTRFLDDAMRAMRAEFEGQVRRAVEEALRSGGYVRPRQPPGLPPGAAARAAFEASKAAAPHPALWAFAVGFLTWWHEAGNRFYGKRAGDGGVDGLGATYQYDAGLEGLACDAVRVLGGWRVARALLQSGAAPHDSALVEATRAIYVGEEE